MAKSGKCSICGAEGELTFEHIPPKAAFNDRGVLLANLRQYWDQDRQERHPSTVQRSKQRRGAGAETLCARCNTTTGSWYGPAYVDWAYQGMGFLNAAPRGSSLALPFHIFPGRIAKQIMCMFGSACGPTFFEGFHDLRRFVLNIEARGIPSRFRVYVFLMSKESTSTRQAGITGLLAGGDVHTFAEISFPPFGYILAINSTAVDRELLDISLFAQHGFRDFRSMHLRMPIRHVNSYFPGDFRTAEEWNAAIGPPPAAE